METTFHCPAATTKSATDLQTFALPAFVAGSFHLMCNSCALHTRCYVCRTWCWSRWWWDPPYYTQAVQAAVLYPGQNKYIYMVQPLHYRLLYSHINWHQLSYTSLHGLATDYRRTYYMRECTAWTIWIYDHNRIGLGYIRSEANIKLDDIDV